MDFRDRFDRQGKCVCMWGFVCVLCLCACQADDVPVQETLALLRATMLRSRRAKFIITGFPRSDADASAFESGVGPVAFWLHLDNPKDARPAELLSSFQNYSAAGRFFPVAASASSVAATLVEARKPFLPQLVVLVGASGSGRGEFASRYV